MMAVDSGLAEREKSGERIKIALIGAGFMAQGLINQITHSVAGMDVAVVVARRPEQAEAAFAYAGVADFRRVSTAEQLAAALRAGLPAVTDDHELALAQPGIDVVIEATGAVEYGAKVVLGAIEHGKHIVLLNAEVDATVGPILKTYADRAGVVLTGCDGDQPGVQANLMRFVRSIGLRPLVAGNIKGLQDRFRTPTTQEGFARQWGQNVHMVTSFADGTKVSFEQALVANAFDMTVTKRGMNGLSWTEHVDKATSLYDLDALRASGPIVDYIVGAQPGPGVYVFAEHPDPRQQHYLKLYKLGDGPLYSFYTPYHLCHFEVPISVARAVLFGDPVIQPMAGPKVDVVAVAKTGLTAGHVLDGLGGYDTYGEAEAYAAARLAGLLPMGLAEGCTLVRDIGIDQPIRLEDVQLPAGRLVDRLWAEQLDAWPA